jgi:hypothetical protein
VVDYLMALPKELESQVNAIVREVARRHGLRKLTSLEREALERGARRGARRCAGAAFPLNLSPAKLA